MSEKEIIEISERINKLEEMKFIEKMSSTYRSDVIRKYQAEINQLEELIAPYMSGGRWSDKNPTVSEA